MTNQYQVKKSGELSDEEIKTILTNWNVERWNELNPDEFRQRFEHSEFHLLTDEEMKILSMARINFKFRLKFDETDYPVAELTGFVTPEILREHGKILLGHMAENIKNRNIEAIGFCRDHNSAYYESCGFKIFYDKVKFLREKKEDSWYTPKEDQDIISLHLTEKTIPVFDQISDGQPGYLIFE